MVFLAFALSSFKEFRLLVKAFFNLRRAAFHSLIAILHSMLNQGDLHLFEGEVFAIVSFAIAINVSVKCFIWTVLFGSWTNLLLNMVLNCCQSDSFTELFTGSLLVRAVGLFFWVLGLVNWGPLSVFISSNSQNLFIISVFSVSGIFWSWCSFLFIFKCFFFSFGEDYLETRGCIGDLLSFDLILVGDFVTWCIIGRVVGVIAAFSSVSVFLNSVCVWADDSSLFSAKSSDVVGVSAALVVSSEAFIL